MAWGVMDISLRDLHMSESVVLFFGLLFAYMDMHTQGNMLVVHVYGVQCDTSRHVHSV